MGCARMPGSVRRVHARKKQSWRELIRQRCGRACAPVATTSRVRCALLVGRFPRPHSSRGLTVTMETEHTMFIRISTTTLEPAPSPLISGGVAGAGSGASTKASGMGCQTAREKRRRRGGACSSGLATTGGVRAKSGWVQGRVRAAGAVGAVRGGCAGGEKLGVVRLGGRPYHRAAAAVFFRDSTDVGSSDVSLTVSARTSYTKRGPRTFRASQSVEWRLSGPRGHPRERVRFAAALPAGAPRELT